MDDMLYDSGLCLESNNSQKKRSFIHRPLVISIINIIFISTRLIGIFIDNVFLLQLIGDGGHIINYKVYINIVGVTFSLISICSQLIYYDNYKRGIKPTFIVILRLSCNQDIRRKLAIDLLTKRTKIIYKLIKINNNFIILLITFAAVLTCFSLEMYLGTLILLGVPHAIFYALWAHTFVNMLNYQIFYFYILCRYLTARLKQLNYTVIRINRGFCRIRVEKIIKAFDALYREIDEYNATYWSKFLAIIWVLFGGTTVLYIIVTIFHHGNLLIILFLFYTSIISTTIFLFTILTAASVNAEASITYPIMS